ncbi:MAG: hypothetical protein ACI8TL_001562 [Natronomonas sp.]|jgi:hypothetical protein
MVGRLWLFLWVSSLLVGLVAGLYVLANVVREAATRDPAKSRPADEPVRETLASEDNQCPNCQAVNDPSFEYCSECAAKL